MNRTTMAAALAALALTLSLTGCGGGGGNGDGGAGGSTGQPAPTAVGQSLGAATTAVIGPAGGGLASADGRLTITVPAGALAADTTIGIEPITDMTRGGEGIAYRLTPHGEAFAQPVTVTLHYDAADTGGTAPENLTLAFQRGDGIWQVADNLVVDTDVGTVTVQTMHFSDWVHVPSYLLSPTSVVVKVGESVSLQVLDCLKPLPDDTSVLALVPGCRPIDEGDYLVDGGDGWSVNGFLWGNGAVGTVDIAGDNVTSARYTAPAVKPDPNQVAVSVAFSRPLADTQTTLVANVTVVADAGAYTGTAHFHRSDLDATATLVWNVYDEQLDVTDYLGSGTLEGTLTLAGCDPLPFAVSVAAGTAADPVSGMSVFNDAASDPYKNAYFFLVQPDPDLMLNLTCSGQPFQIPAATLAFPVDSRICPSGGSMLYHTNIDQLQGSWSCTARDLTADWDFSRS